MRVVVGRAGRPHGIRGEVVIGVRTDEPDLRFAVGATVDVWSSPDDDPDDDGTGERLTVASARWHSGQLLVAFAGITDRTAAAELTGSWLSVDSSQLPDTGDPDEFRDHELIGLSVRTCAGDRWAWSPTCCTTARTCWWCGARTVRRRVPGAVREGDRARGRRAGRCRGHRPAPRAARLRPGAVAGQE